MNMIFQTKREVDTCWGWLNQLEQMKTIFFSSRIITVFTSYTANSSWSEWLAWTMFIEYYSNIFKAIKSIIARRWHPGWPWTWHPKWGPWSPRCPLYCKTMFPFDGLGLLKLNTCLKSAKIHVSSRVEWRASWGSLITFCYLYTSPKHGGSWDPRQKTKNITVFCTYRFQKESDLTWKQKRNNDTSKIPHTKIRNKCIVKNKQALNKWHPGYPDIHERDL